MTAPSRAAERALDAEISRVVFGHAAPSEAEMRATLDAWTAEAGVVVDALYYVPRLGGFYAKPGELIGQPVVVWASVPDYYSTDIAAAWLVVEAWRARGIYIDVETDYRGYRAVWGREGRDGEDVWISGATDHAAQPALPVCLAALAAVASLGSVDPRSPVGRADGE